jgi:diadenylate cyclase
MINCFLTLSFFDLLDIILVAFLLYYLYMLIRGTVAINIFIGVFSVYLIWLLTKALNMQLLSTILGQFMGVGVIALVVVFQQEIRKFLLIIGSRYRLNKVFSLENLFMTKTKAANIMNIKSIVKACKNMSASKTGALIVISVKSELRNYIQTGELINSEISSRIIESIFYKNNPLHDGALIIEKHRIKACRCILPISDNPNLIANHGFRHRAALGMAQATDAIVIVVSEQTGIISIAKSGVLRSKIESEELAGILEKEL